MTSLRAKIIISTLFIIFLIIAGSYIVIQNIQKGIIEGEFRDKGYLLANHLAVEFNTPLLENNLLEIKNYIDNLKGSYPDLEYVFVTDSEGIVLVHTFGQGFPEALQNNSKPSNVNKEFIFSTNKGIIHEFDAPLFKNIGYVHVGLSENRVRAQILEASRNLLLIAISGLLLGGVFIFFIGRRLTEPIRDLTEGAKRINNGVLGQKIRIDSSDELGVLAATFNDMASSLDKKMRDLINAKEQTETAQKYLETLFDRIEDGLIVLNSRHEVIKTNESFLKIVGLAEEQVIGKSCYEVIFGASFSPPQGEICSIDSMAQARKPVRIVHEVNIAGGKKTLEITGSLFSDSRGEINIILVVRDVTQQKTLEKEIIARNRELTVINEISKNISESFDLNRIFSKTLEDLLKLTAMESAAVYLQDELSGNLILKLLAGSDGTAIEAKTIEQIIKNNEVLIVENVQGIPDLIKTDQISFVSFAGIPLRVKDKIFGIITLESRAQHNFSDKDRQLFSAIGNQLGVAIENITFYNNVKYLKEFNEEILNNVNLAIHVVDKDMKILAINDELLTLSRGKLKKEEMINKNLFEVYPFLKDRNVDKEYEYVIKSGEIFQTEDRTEYYGDIIYTSTSKIPIKDKSGKVEKVITVMKDVTDQKRLEEELKDSYEELRLTYLKLKELYKIKDNFLSNMSHELRTPLTSIIGYTELLLEQNITPEQKHELEVILRNSKRLSGLINGLLDTAIIESRGIALDTQMLSIHDLLFQVAEDMKTTAAIKKIPVYIDVPKQLMIKGDKDRLTQVLTNILDNAIKFTIKGKIKMAAEMENEFVHIKINDTGVGIPEEKLDKIFDRFYQLDLPNGQKSGGAGLGLWISKNIVEAHKGKIWAESKNRGSTFHVLLPKG